MYFLVLEVIGNDKELVGKNLELEGALDLIGSKFLRGVLILVTQEFKISWSFEGSIENASSHIFSSSSTFVTQFDFEES